METPIQEVRFILTANDYWHHQLHAYARKRPTQIKAVIFFAAIMVIASLLTRQSIFLFAGAVFVVLTFSVAFLMMHQTARKSARSLRNKGTYITSISKEGIRQKNEQTDSLTRWHAVEAIDTDDHNIYFQMDTPGSIFVAITIPKSAFGDTATVEQFLQVARNYWRGEAQQ